MRLLSVNLGVERTLERKNRVEQTGIFKLPTAEAVKAGKLGLEGDVILDKKNHGGPDQAVYVYGAADYAWWSDELGTEIAAGTFGENLTISELESARFNVGGDISGAGDVGSGEAGRAGAALELERIRTITIVLDLHLEVGGVALGCRQ